MAARSLGRGVGRLRGVLVRAGSGAHTAPPQARAASYPARRAQAAREPAAFWGPLARDTLVWDAPYHTVCDCDFGSGKIGWFLGGRLNVTGELERSSSLSCTRPAIPPSRRFQLYATNFSCMP